jgi:Catalase
MTQAESPRNNLRFVPYRPELESPRDDEQQLIDKIIASLRKNNEKAYKKYEHGIRDAHAKSHGILRGQLTVLPDLPEHLAQGMFATPATYDIVARLSTTAGARRSDQVRGVRGLGIKVLRVPGNRLLADEATTQDFVFVNEPRFPFRDALHYSKGGMRLARLLSYTPDILMRTGSLLLRGIQRLLSPFGGELYWKVAIFAEPNTHTLGQTFYTAAPLQYGKYVAKLCVAPLSPSVTALKDVIVGKTANAHTEAVVDFFKNNSAEYEVRVQLCTDKDKMPIENASVLWSETDSPYERVAKITYPAQDPHTKARMEYGDDVLEFNSWRAIEAHRPLGSINRLKRDVYLASSKFRHEKNGRERVEPSEATDIPD